MNKWGNDWMIRWIMKDPIPYLIVKIDIKIILLKSKSCFKADDNGWSDDDGTWNKLGISYLRNPELSV